MHPKQVRLGHLAIRARRLSVSGGSRLKREETRLWHLLGRKLAKQMNNKLQNRKSESRRFTMINAYNVVVAIEGRGGYQVGSISGVDLGIS